ncbi:MAG: hypothetical protein IKB34_01800 [Clostridia bacterium]|nr:hypothetical protein [Clostridia bacterium]
MNYCKDCGALIGENEDYCPDCEKARAKKPNEGENPPTVSHSKREINSGMLTLAIVTLVFNTLFGIVATVCVVRAADAYTDSEEERNLKTAKLVSMVGLAISVGVVLIRIMSILALF